MYLGLLRSVVRSENMIKLVGEAAREICSWNPSDDIVIYYLC